MIAALMALMGIGSKLAEIKGNNKTLTSQAQGLATQAATQVRSDLSVLSLREQQAGSQISLEQVRRFRQGVRERGTLASRLADSGVGGGTSIRDAVASVIQEEQDVATLETNRTWMESQSALEKKAAVTRGQSAINQSQGLLDQRTTGVGGVLQLIGAGVSGYSQGTMLEPMSAGKIPKAVTPRATTYSHSNVGVQ